MSTVIRELRTARGLTQVHLAKRAKVKRGYLAQLETGHKTNPSLPILRKLAKALGVPVTELLG
jgi:transcriptional regulator with XRE-family HTH domain